MRPAADPIWNHTGAGCDLFPPPDQPMMTAPVETSSSESHHLPSLRHPDDVSYSHASACSASQTRFVRRGAKSAGTAEERVSPPRPRRYRRAPSLSRLRVGRGGQCHLRRGRTVRAGARLDLQAHDARRSRPYLRRGCCGLHRHGANASVLLRGRHVVTLSAARPVTLVRGIRPLRAP
jgi:hypothetical protein